MRSERREQHRRKILSALGSTTVEKRKTRAHANLSSSAGRRSRTRLPATPAAKNASRRAHGRVVRAERANRAAPGGEPTLTRESRRAPVGGLVRTSSLMHMSNSKIEGLSRPSQAANSHQRIPPRTCGWIGAHFKPHAHVELEN